jgi:putative Mg2+ transporter-C (MgtC) family protein
MNSSQFLSMLATYWSSSALATNALVLMNLLGALALGALVGYERSYHGRAAGMRTYGLVCMAAAGLTVVAGQPAAWYGGSHLLAVPPDPTRVMQGIVTGIGFLGAGVIVKEGLNISGLTTAASIWAASCIGVLVGVGFYASAILLAALSAATMMWGSRFENWLPTHNAVAVTLRYRPHAAPDLGTVCAFMRRHGYEVAPGSISIASAAGQPEWRFVTVRATAAGLDVLARELPGLEGLADFSLTHARN